MGTKEINKPPHVFTRNKYGLIEDEAVKYHYTKDGTVDWRKMIISALLSIQVNTVIFSHFMVMNALASFENDAGKLLSYYPDYTSSIKIIIRNKSIISIQIDKEKKTKINI